MPMPMMMRPTATAPKPPMPAPNAGPPGAAPTPPAPPPQGAGAMPARPPVSQPGPPRGAPPLLRNAQQANPQVTPQDKHAIQVAIQLASQMIYKDPTASKKLALMLHQQPQDRSVTHAVGMVMHVIVRRMGSMFPLKVAPAIAYKVLEMVYDLGESLKLLPGPPEGPKLVAKIGPEIQMDLLRELKIDPRVVQQRIAVHHAKPSSKPIVASAMGAGAPSPTTPPPAQAEQLPSIAAGGEV